MNIYETQPDNHLMEQLIAMSADWEAEDSTYGYYKNCPEDILGNRVFLAEENGRILGYLFFHSHTPPRDSSVMQKGTSCFEIEELYVIPEFRSRGIGKALFLHAEHLAKEEGAEFITLTTATKKHQRILHFYIDELGMDFWSARLFKNIR